MKNRILLILILAVSFSSCKNSEKRKAEARRNRKEYAVSINHLNSMKPLLAKLDAFPGPADTILPIMGTTEFDSLYAFRCMDYEMFRFATGAINEDAYKKYTDKDKGMMDIERKPLWLSSPAYNDFINTALMKDTAGAGSLAYELEQDSIKKVHFLIVIKTLKDEPGGIADDKTFNPAYFQGQCYLIDYEKGELLCAFTLEASNSEELKFDTHGAIQEDEKVTLENDLHENAYKQLCSILSDITGIPKRLVGAGIAGHYQ